MRSPVLLVACLLPLACTTTTAQVDGNEPNPEASAELVEPDREPPPSEVEPGAAATEVELPDCPDDQGSLPAYCTERGELAGRWLPVDMLRVPDDVDVLFFAEPGDAPPQASLTIAARGDELYIQHVTCGACRRVLGQGFAGWLSHMSEDQRAQMQAQLGLDARVPVMASTADWAEFCRDAAGEAALMEIVARAEDEADARRHGR